MAARFIGGFPMTFDASRLLDSRKVNNPKNDFKARDPVTVRSGEKGYDRYQVRFDKNEAGRLVKAILARYPPAEQKRVLREIHHRSKPLANQLFRRESISLTKGAADRLNAFAADLGVRVRFRHDQKPPLDARF